MLVVEDITIRQGRFDLRADFSLGDGQIAAILGPSGSGKSTLLNALCGFLPLTKGRVLWRGQDLCDHPPGARPMAMLFQDHNLFAHLSAAQNVGLGVRPDLKLSDDQHGAVRAALKRVGLAGFETRRPGTLSGGQQSRVALARVLVQQRPLLLLDEPFSALGPALRAEMLDLLAELAGERGQTVLMVSHAPEDARRVSDALILVEGGQAHAPVPTAEGFATPSPALRSYLG